MKVDFFIVGAMRSGTSSIRDQLSIDPQINMARGEPMFFSNDEKYKKGLDFYHGLFEEDEPECIIRGEKSPRYAVSPDAPKRIHDYNPNAKIIWILRNPVKRAISHYIHSIYRAGDKALSMEYAIENADELERINSTMAYLYRSQYEKQLAAWHPYFPRQKVVILEEMINRPKKIMNEVYEYLGISPCVELDFLKHSRQKVDIAKAEVEKNNPISSAEKEKLYNALTSSIDAVENILGKSLISWRTF